MNQHLRVIHKLLVPALLSALSGGCAAAMTAEEIERATALRDARCQSLKQQIDAARSKPLQRDYLLRQYDRECRRP